MSEDRRSKEICLLLMVVQEGLVQDIIAAFIELDITGVTIISSQGMGRTIAYEFPIFAGFMNEMRGAKSYNKTIFAAIEDLSRVTKQEALLREIDIDFSQPNTGVIFTLPLCCSKGTNLCYNESEDD